MKSAMVLASLSGPQNQKLFNSNIIGRDYDMVTATSMLCYVLAQKG